MRRLFVVLPSLLLPQICFALPFQIDPGEAVAEFLLFSKSFEPIATVMLATGLFLAVRTKNKHAKKFSSYVQNYYLGQAETYKDIALTTLRVSARVTGSVLDKAIEEGLEEAGSEGISLKTRRPISERIERFTQKIDKKFRLPGEKKIYDHGYFFNPQNRARSLGHIMAELQFMAVPVPAAPKFRSLRKVIVGAKAIRSAKYGRVLIGAVSKCVKLVKPAFDSFFGRLFRKEF